MPTNLMNARGVDIVALVEMTFESIFFTRRNRVLNTSNVLKSHKM